MCEVHGQHCTQLMIAVAHVLVYLRLLSNRNGQHAVVLLIRTAASLRALLL